MTHWYMLAADGRATLCADRADAEQEARDADAAWPRMGPHRAVQLVDANELRRIRYEPIPDKLDGWSGFMATCAVRHCLGRGSYAPSVAMDWCRDHWRRLSQKDHHNIVRDVIRWLADRVLFDKPGDAHMGDYRADWRNFALWAIEQSGDDFGRAVVGAALYTPEHREAPEVAQFKKWMTT